jgi:hypothetical protein
MRRRKNLELKGQARGRRKANGKQSPNLALDTRFLKGTGLALHLRRRARRVSKTFAHSRARPSETAARNHDASTPAMCRLAENEHGLDGAVTSVTSAEMPAPTTSPTLPLRPKLPQQNLQDRNGY